MLSSLSRRRGHDPVSAMLDLVRERAGGEDNVELNPLFTAHLHLDPTEQEWAAAQRAAAGPASAGKERA